MLTVTYGVMNSENAKPPRPPASANGFEWPSDATAKERRAFAASLQELLPTKDWNHARLAAALWGTDKYTSRNIAKTREWIRAGKFPSDEEAAYVAEVLEVPMSRLLQPEGEFSSKPQMVRKHRGVGGVKLNKNGAKRAGWGEKRRAAEDAKMKAKGKKGNGHDHDTRWLLPEGVEPPVVKMESSKKHPSLMLFELKGEMPVEVAMAIMSMASAKRAE